MTQQCGRLVAVAVGGGGGRVGEGEKGKINTASALFSGAAERGDLLWGNDDLCRGGRAVRVRGGRRCAPIMINALHPGDVAASATPTPPL